MVKSLVIINQYIGSPQHGMEYRHYYLAKHMTAQGYRVTLISGSYSHLYTSLPEATDTFTKEMIDGIEYIWINTPTYASSKSLGRIWNMVCFAWRLKFLHLSEPAHILVSSPSIFPVKTGHKLAKKYGTKFLFEVRDIWPLTLIELSNISSNNPLIKIMEYYERYAYKNADRIISLLPKAKEYFLSKGMGSNKFRYVPNGIEVLEEHSRPLPSKVEQMIPEGKFIIAYAGTIGIANNLGYLLEAAKELSSHTDIHFIILGHGGEKQKLQKKVECYALENVSFFDPISKEMVGAFLEKVDVAFISLLPEKLFRFGVSPNKVFEYMYAKKPILWAVKAGNNPVEEAQCGISVPLNNIQRLKEAVLELKSLSHEKREALGQNGYNFVKTHHSYAILAEKLKKIVEE